VRRFITLVSILTIVGSGLPATLLAQSKPPTGKRAQEVANRAIASLAGWRTRHARRFLEMQKGRFGSTPQFRTAWALLEIQEGANGNTELADRGLADLSALAKNKKVDAMASFHLGEILSEKDRLREAAAAWKAAARIVSTAVWQNPYDATAQFYLGAALVRGGRYEEGREALLMAARGGFDPAMVNHQIGLAYLLSESWMEAKDALDYGIAIEPRYAPMYFWRAMAWDKLNRKDEMLMDLHQYVKLTPHGPFADEAKSTLNRAGG
jgi:tetratricopeptide (TPR) repeat protein